MLTVQPIFNITEQTRNSKAIDIKVFNEPPHIKKLEALSSLAQASYKANVLPSLLLLSTLLPLLLKSTSPRLAVLSSVAAEIPAPTRALYAGHKAALSMLLRSLRIELENLIVEGGAKKSIGITIVYPASIKTGLRASALDAPNETVHHVDAGAINLKEDRKALSPLYVAKQVVRAIDQEKDELWLPEAYWWISKIGMILVPGIVKRGAKRKYAFP